MVLNQLNAICGSSYDTVKIKATGFADDQYGYIKYYDCFGNQISGFLEVILGSVVFASRASKGGIEPNITGNATLVTSCKYDIGSGNNKQTNGIYVYRVNGECTFGVL